MTWDDIDFQGKSIYIVSAKKHRIPFRDVPLHPDLEKDLRRWQKEDEDKTAPEIITFNDKPLSSVKTAFRNAKRRAGITRRIRLYDFRHAAVTMMLASGGDLKSVSQIAGHSRTDTTTRIYQHTSIELLSEQINLIPSLENKPAGNDNVIEIVEALKNKTRKTE